MHWSYYRVMREMFQCITNQVVPLGTWHMNQHKGGMFVLKTCYDLLCLLCYAYSKSYGYNSCHMLLPRGDLSMRPYTV